MKIIIDGCDFTGKTTLINQIKAYNEYKKGAVVVLLIPARTDTKYFHEFIYKKGFEIRFIKGRLKFIHESGNEGKAAPFPSMIIIMK